VVLAGLLHAASHQSVSRASLQRLTLRQSLRRCVCMRCCVVRVVRFECIDRLVQGLSAVFLALRRRPVIRYQKSSSAAQRLAEGLYALTYKQQVWQAARGCCCMHSHCTC
jgi:hypothetical protein